MRFFSLFSLVLPHPIDIQLALIIRISTTSHNCCLPGLARLPRHNTLCAPGIFTLSAPTPVPTHPSANSHLRLEAHLARCHTPAIINGFVALVVGRVPRWRRHRAHLCELILSSQSPPRVAMGARLDDLRSHRCPALPSSLCTYRTSQHIDEATIWPAQPAMALCTGIAGITVGDPVVGHGMRGPRQHLSVRPCRAPGCIVMLRWTWLLEKDMLVAGGHMR